MNRSIYKTHVFVTAGLFVSFLFVCLGGCGDSSEAKKAKQMADSMDKAGRLIAAGQEKLPLTGQEKKKILDQTVQKDKPLTVPEKQRIADDILGRNQTLSESEEFKTFQTQMDQLTAELDQAADPDQYSRICSQMLGLCDQILLGQEKMDQALMEVPQQRYEQAKELLEAVVSKGSKQTPSAQAASDLMLATLEQARARRLWNQMQEKQLEIQDELLGMSVLAIQLESETTQSRVLETHRPDQAIAVLQTQMQEMQIQRQQLDEEIETFVQKTDQAEQLYQQNLKQSQQNQREYLELLHQSEKSPGTARFDLIQQAYQLRMGQQGQPGGVDYDAMTEMSLNNLEALKRQLVLKQNQREQLVESLSRLGSSLERLQTEPQYHSLLDQKALELQEKQSRLTESMKRHFQLFLQKNESYSKLRVRAVDAYRDAGERLEQAAGAAGQAGKELSQTRKYAQQLREQVVHRELADLWLADAALYDFAASSFELFQRIPGIQDQVLDLIDENRKQAQLARSSAEEMIKSE